MRITVDLVNLSPSYALGDDISERIWTGKSSFYDYLQAFAYKEFVHIPKYSR